MQKLTGGGRSSNIELLRIVAMFLVLYVHADFLSLGAPDAARFAAAPLDASASVLAQSLAVVCVNVFVMISGWFGIRPKVRSAASLLFQIFFLIFLINCVAWLAGLGRPGIMEWADCFLLTKGYWFPKAYLMLYLAAPALNALVEHTSRWQLRVLLILFFLFQTVYGCIFSSAAWFAGGYSPVSFAGLYLLMRYVRLYSPRYATLKARTDLQLYLGLALVNTGCVVLTGFLAQRMPLAEILLAHAMGKITGYVNPLTIAASLFLLLAFSKLRLQSKAVNWLAASAFAVFLLHGHRLIFGPVYAPVCQALHEAWGAAYFLLVIPILAGVYVACVLVDQLRIFVWKRIEGPADELVRRLLRRL